MDVKNALLTILPTFISRYAARLEASPLNYRLVRGAFWAFIGAIVSRSLMLGANFMVARILGKEGFGELGIIQSTITMFSTFTGFGLGVTATKHIAEFRTKNPEKAGRIISLSGIVATGSGVLIGLLLWIFAPWLAENTLAAPRLAGLLRIGTILLFLATLNGAQTGALYGFEAFKTAAQVNLWAALLSFPLLVGGVYWWGLEGAVWGLVAGMGINLLLTHLAIRMEAHRAGVPLGFKGCKKEWKILWKFSVPAILAGAMVSPINWACNAILVNQPGGYAEMGIFNAANQWFLALLFLPTLFGQALLPILSEGLGNRDSINSGRMLNYSIKLNAIMIAPIVILGCILSPSIMELYGTSFKSAWPTLMVVLFTCGILAVQTQVGQFILASGKIWMGLFMNLGWGLAFLALTLSLVSQGAMGLAAARAGAYMIHGIATFSFAYYVIKSSKMQNSVEK